MNGVNMKTWTWTAVLACAAAMTGAATPSPYAAHQDGPIKSLTPEEQSALLEGQGMGFAKAAELNGYPGPKHVLELADELALSAAQRDATQALFERMRAAARAGGAELLQAERALDALYSSRTATESLVKTQLGTIEALRARLRGVHLNAHLEQAALLTKHQSVQYAQLRGYRPAGHRH
jgi:Spy/CpxP family protein refolding chaperone